MTTTAPSATTTITGVDIFGPATNDTKRLIAFYRDVLGIVPTSIDETEGGAEFELADGSTFGLWSPGPDTKPGAGYTALFAVADIDAALALFRSRGAEIADAFETPVCFIARGTDVDGNPFYIHQRKPAV
jgi:predicted enzyme related to lactoylglutathione lyase